jgi:ribosomal protein S18 acetylase RimI-like enzyme
MTCEVRFGTVEEVVALSKQIPEFDNPHQEGEYRKGLDGKKHLILVAYMEGQLVGFKVGYDKENDGSFYSWMGGVLPANRQQHVAQQLASVQEAWAKQNGYHRIRCKTRNRHKAMLMFALRNSFQIIAIEPKETIAEYRILLQKDL